MKILYDHQAFAMQKYGGVSRCFVELYKNMPLEIDASISLCKSDNVYVKEIMEVRPKDTWIDHFLNNHNFKGKWHVQTVLNQYRERRTDENVRHSVALLKQGDYDIFHPTFFDDYFLPYLKGKPFVLTIHDMTPELYPQYFGKDNPQIEMKRKLAPIANAIIAVSENTKQDVIRILGIPNDKIHVVYHGCSFPPAENEASPFPFPYLLFVGGRGWFKNFVPFVKSVAPVLKKHKDLKVICTSKPFTPEETQLFIEHGILEQFIHKWAGTDLELSTLYHHAECFVFPSDYEGFGIPILEAYKSNCPVLLNRASCFPEIAGDAAIFFHNDPDGKDLTEKLETMLSMNTKERNVLIAKQQSQLKRFSWEESARKLTHIYESLL